MRYFLKHYLPEWDVFGVMAGIIYKERRPSWHQDSFFGTFLFFPLQHNPDQYNVT